MEWGILALATPALDGWNSHFARGAGAVGNVWSAGDSGGGSLRA